MAAKEIRVGMLGCGFMGKAHSFGYRNCNAIWAPELKLVMKCISGSEPEDVVKGAEQLGVELNEHIAFVIEALKPVAAELGIAGTQP